ncbi:MAG: hypothetical protein QOH71_3165 [Blastocatellia bacterium]|jgi:hypothetical protein|nr:hypothetical protein [Blastocatellia bacterium]
MQSKPMMKKLFAVLISIVALAFCQSVLGQATTPALKHFASHGLSFDYPATIELDDHSTAVGQHLVIQSKGQAQIMVLSRFALINTAAELDAARHEIVDSFVETMWKQIQADDSNVSRADARIEIAGAQATGVRMRAVLNNEPGNAEIYSLQLGSRLVIVSLIGSDREIAASAPAWLAIRRSLKIEAAM